MKYWSTNTPTGPLDHLFEDVDVLHRLCKCRKSVSSLEDSNLRQSVLDRIALILDSGDTSVRINDQVVHLKSEIEELTNDNSKLRDELTRLKNQMDSDAYAPEEVSTPHSSSTGFRWIVVGMFILITIIAGLKGWLSL